MTENPALADRLRRIEARLHRVVIRNEFRRALVLFAVAEVATVAALLAMFEFGA